MSQFFKGTGYQMACKIKNFLVQLSPRKICISLLCLKLCLTASCSQHPWTIGGGIFFFLKKPFLLRKALFIKHSTCLPRFLSETFLCAIFSRCFSVVVAQPFLPSAVCRNGGVCFKILCPLNWENIITTSMGGMKKTNVQSCLKTAAPHGRSRLI